MRVISLVPSLTELVWWLGRGDWLAGRTRFCVEPAGAIERVPAVGGTKTPKVERIAATAPDLVIANREENRQEDVVALRDAGVEVVVTEIDTVEEALAVIEELGRRLDARERAAELIAEVRAALEGRHEQTGPRVFVPIWTKPLMGLGSGTYGADLLARCGAHNVLEGRARYPEVTDDELAALGPDLVLLPDEPYPFGEGDVERFAAPGRRVELVDGKWLWWYGPRMPEAIRGLRALLLEAVA